MAPNGAPNPPAPGSGNSNLVVNGDFEQGDKVPAGWEDPVTACRNPLAQGTRRIRWEQGLGVEGSRGIGIEIDKAIAEGYGQGYFSEAILVDPDATYRVTLEVKSDGPNAILFVKGYAHSGPGAADREVYSHHKEAHFERYLKDAVKRKEFVIQSFAFQPRHPKFHVDYIKVWLYGYLKAGMLCFDNVRVEKTGRAAEGAAPEPARESPLDKPPDPDGDSPPIYLDPKGLTK